MTESDAVCERLAAPLPAPLAQILDANNRTRPSSSSSPAGSMSHWDAPLLVSTHSPTKDGDSDTFGSDQ